MPNPSCDDQDFIDGFQSYGPAEWARQLGIGERPVFARRKRIERRLGIKILLPAEVAKTNYRPTDFPQRLESDIADGTVVVASDCHYWPGIISTAHRALIKFCAHFKPHTIVMNGDVLDGADISRHPPLSWEDVPKLKEEIETCKLRLQEVRDASPDSHRIWTLGNHDARFEMRLASKAPEFAEVNGVHLKDHFPDWRPAMAFWINDEVVIKHRYKGGEHAAHNNAKESGKTMVTGHLHSLKVAPYTDYNGTRFGVDTGTLADPMGPQFSYSEDNPKNHRSGFCILTFKEGRLLWPEFVHVIDEGLVEFRGETYEV